MWKRIGVATGLVGAPVVVWFGTGVPLTMNLGLQFSPYVSTEGKIALWLVLLIPMWVLLHGIRLSYRRSRSKK